jgi:hypothetical protein
MARLRRYCQRHHSFTLIHSLRLKPSIAVLTKLADMLWSNELQRRLDAEGVPIVVIPVHPGGVNSGWNEDLPFPKLASMIGSLFLSHPDQAAYTQVFAAGSKEVAENRDKYKNAYLTPVAKIGAPTVTSQNAELAAELWKTTEDFLASIDVK